MKKFSHFSACLCLVLVAHISGRSQKPELVVQTGHSKIVNTVAFSWDGKTLASGSADATVKLWDVSTRIELRTLKGHSNAVNAVVFSPDGKSLASGSADDTVRLWDVSTGNELRTLGTVRIVSEQLSHQINSIDFSPDGKLLASASADHTVKLWEVMTGKVLRTFKNHPDEVHAVAFSPDGKILADGGSHYAIKLWDVATGKELRTLKGNYDLTDAIAFSPDGTTIAGGTSGNGTRIKIWDVKTGKELLTFKADSDQVFSIAYSPDGKSLASGGLEQKPDRGGETVKLWDVKTGIELRHLKTNSRWASSVAFSPDGKILASGGSEYTVKLWELSTGALSSTIEGRPNPFRELSPDANVIVIVNRDGVFTLWDVPTATELRSFKGHTEVSSVAFSPDGKTLASAGYDQIRILGSETVKLWDASSGKELSTLKGPVIDASSVAFSPDGNTLAASGYRNITLWDVSTFLELRTLEMSPDFVGRVVFSPDGRTFASESSNTVTLWDVATGKELRTLKGDYDQVSRGVAFSPDGKKLASASIGSTVKLLDVSNFTELYTLNEVTSVTFSSDGMTIASASADHTIRLWDVATGKKLRTFEVDSDPVNSVKFILNNRYIVSWSDTTISLWESAVGTKLATLISFDEHDWIVVTPEGLFDGSPGSWNKIVWRFNNNTFDHAPVEAFFNEFFYPGLLADIIAGKNPKAPSDISLKDRRQPQLKLTLADARPDATLAARNVKVKIDVRELAANKDNKRASGAQDLRLFRNGSLVSVWHGDVLKGQSSITLEATVPVVAGANNFTAYAFNHDNIKSSDASLTITGAESLKRKGTLYILAVGVSRYANPEYNLSYITDDATSFASQLKLQQDKLGHYQPVEIKTLLNQDATKQGILTELKKAVELVQPEDAVVIYFSGHGKASGDHFYLLPHDLGYSGPRDQLSDEGLQQILAHSISDAELEEAFRGIDAGQMFMIIDACNSGQALENRDEPRRGPMNTRGLAQLAYEKGIYILTASQNVEDAFVSERLKHSYLTYALVEEGLKSKVADADHNGEIVLREWFDYALVRVPKLREETLQTKSLEEVTPKLKAAKSQKSQTPRVFYRREANARPLIIAKP